LVAILMSIRLRVLTQMLPTCISMYINITNLVLVIVD